MAPSDFGDSYPLKFPAGPEIVNPPSPKPPHDRSLANVWKNKCEATLEVTGREKVHNKREIIMGGVRPIVLILGLRAGGEGGGGHITLRSPRSCSCAAEGAINPPCEPSTETLPSLCRLKQFGGAAEAEPRTY